MGLAGPIRDTVDPARTRPLRAGAWLAAMVGIGVAAGVLLPRPWGALVVGATVALGVAGLVLHLERSRESLLHEARSLWGLSGVIGDGRVWPAPGGWALGADALAWTLARVGGRRAITVVELGPGTSSVVLGRCLPSASMWGLEHDEGFVASVRRLLEQHQLGHYTVLHAPLAPGRDGVVWYAEDAVARLPEQVDLLIVDGPPNLAGGGNRAAALPRLRERLAAGALVLVDDTHRADERRMAREWCASDPTLSVVHDGGSFMVLQVAGVPVSPEPGRAV